MNAGYGCRANPETMVSFARLRLLFIVAVIAALWIAELVPPAQGAPAAATAAATAATTAPSPARAKRERKAGKRQKAPAAKEAAANAATSETQKAAARRDRGDRGEWLDPVKDEPAGTHFRSFFSKTVNTEASYLIYLPPDYETAKDKRYPVIYWLHGGGGSQRTGDYFIEKLDAAIRAKAAPPVIAILVNGVGGSLFSDSIDGQKPVETVIIRDLIPHVDQTYRTIATRGARAIEGFSMGGFGSLHLGFKYPQLFGSVTALAHAPIRPNSGWPKVDNVWKTGPFAGNEEYFKGNDPFRLVEKNAAEIKAGTRVRLIVGDADQPNTVARTKELHEKMKAMGLPCELTIVPGVKHSYMNLYDAIGDPVFAYYAQLFAGARQAAALTP